MNVEDIMWLDDGDFERAVKQLDMRGILWLMEALQTAMCDEQRRFETLTLQLQKYPDRNSYNHRKISAALCTSQRLLTNLCTKHMMCCGQRSSRSSSEGDATTLQTMASSPLQEGGTTGFKESLRFFQSQVDKVDTNTGKKTVNCCPKTQSETKTTSVVPTVDNILSNVKNLYFSRNTFDQRIKKDDNINSVKTSENKLCQNSVSSQRSQQVYLPDKPSISDHNKKSSLLSNFNPSLETSDQDLLNNKNLGSTLPHLKLNPQVFNLFDASDLMKNQHLRSYDKLNTDTSVSTINNSSNEYIVLNSVATPDKKMKQNSKRDHIQTPDNRTFKLSKDIHAQMELKKPSIKSLEEQGDQTVKSSESARLDEYGKKEDETSITEIHVDCFESDYDSQDFVVHKANFAEDYIEEISEDSSVKEDYEDCADPDIPPPDYVSDEEVYIVQQGDGHEEDIEFVDNIAEYMNDPRRYIYYPDEKELEVIPEEDEDIEDDHMFSHEEPGGFRISNASSDDSRYINHGECDSGLTDDQRSNSSTAEECDLEDDTDSAKGSLPLQDSSNESPVGNDRSNMFQNVEYHKSNKKSGLLTKPIFEKTKEVFSDEEQNDVQPRSLTSSWHPKELLDVLYRLDFPNEPSKKQTRYINKEGYLEKLPSGRKKATYWNPWKTKYIRLKDGFLFCFDNSQAEKPSMTVQLMGGHVDTLENKMIGVDDQKGHYVVLRCLNEDDVDSWENALRSQCADDFVNAYTSPCLKPLHINKNVIIIDLGSCSVRAGILMSSPSLPQLFFPTVCATNKISHKNIFGIEALNPSTRKDSYLTFPLHPSAKVTKYSMDVSLLPDLLKHIFQELNIYPEDYKVQLSMPRNLSLQTKLKVARILLDDFRVKGLNLTHQAILSLHAYNSKSGIIVDIGDRLDVMPIIEGYIVESGVTRIPHGGQRMVHHLKHALAEKNISLISDVESYLARYVLEQLCYVAEDYTEELQRYHTHLDHFEMSLSTSHFFNNQCPWEEIILDLGRFHVPEGLFTPEIWGLDNPGLHKLVYHAIQECGVDLRREMTKSIYVSGGLTLLPGFVERLEVEIDKLTPNTVTPKVHASPYRYHMSYIGACQIALEDKFDDICITKKMWRKEGNTCVKKWHT